jgi:selenocysteine lyase/cysteine desulfurase
MEHNSVLRPLACLEDLCRVRVEHVPLKQDMKLDEGVYDKLLAQRPRLVVVTHASNVTGRINPVRLWFQKAISAGAATLLDASQTVGRISVKPDELCADMLAFPGHKGLRGPMGTGALYVSPAIQLNPTFVGGTGVKGDARRQPEDMPTRLEAGTPNTPAFAGLNAAVLHYMEHMADIAAKEATIAETLLSNLLAIPNVRVLDADFHNRLPVMAFVIDGMDAETAGFALSRSFNIDCRTGLHCAPLLHKALGMQSIGTIRFSPSYTNTPAEIDYALEAVRRIAE